MRAAEGHRLELPVMIALTYGMQRGEVLGSAMVGRRLGDQCRRRHARHEAEQERDSSSASRTRLVLASLRRKNRAGRSR